MIWIVRVDWTVFWRPDENSTAADHLVGRPGRKSRSCARHDGRCRRQGARFILTPEVTNCVSTSTTQQREVLQHEEDDIFLAGLREQAAALGVWLLIGSLGIKTHDADGRLANRSFMINPQGEIVARYDKIYMFDVQVTELRHSANQQTIGPEPGPLWLIRTSARSE
ncbi:nitrilase-related carbon-nitrogen hydrolase (plasmid) [Microbulbifer sp. SSSA002]|uniref:nitrilase-related carbon-nitrogen hydrolase n=1 Tax=Microbulbifer sp. SSSA002 TaxID=3243376 RepID=UPI004039A89D